MKGSSIRSIEELPIMLNTQQVAQLTGYGQQCIRELCHTKQIPFVQFGRAFKFPRDGVLQWIELTAKKNSGMTG